MMMNIKKKISEKNIKNMEKKTIVEEIILNNYYIKNKYKTTKADIFSIRINNELHKQLNTLSTDLGVSKNMVLNASLYYFLINKNLITEEIKDT
jgi:hypothetical protein